ncbi:MAG TPA: ATP-binding protein [Candidatus Limnocylindria bacterium]|nr:ATP-binding protein [Candidatus Limnocylindria bacterium]
MPDSPPDSPSRAETKAAGSRAPDTAPPATAGPGPGSDPTAGSPANPAEQMKTDLVQRALELKRLNDQLQEKASLLDKARDAILVRDMDHRITYWNKSAERLYGWTAEEAAGRSAETLLQTDAEAFQRAFEQVFRTGEWTGELRKVAKNGSTLTVESHWTLVRDAEGRPVSILDINTDISARKKAEQQMLRAQRMESIGTLSGGVAHDLNNVLTPIVMSLDLLRIHCQNPEAEHLLATLQLSAERGAGLIRQLLSFSRGMEGDRIVVNVAHILGDLGKVIREVFPKNIEIELPQGDEAWTVLGDPTQLHQVFLNLLVNARDAMPGGGRLSVALENVVLDELYAGTNADAKPGPYLRVTVADTGLGMAPKILYRIFEPFFTTKKPGTGTGLGLSTTLTIVKSHGGFINVYSEPGKGTTITVHLPASAAAAAPASRQPSRPALPRGNGELILLVDDEAGIRTVAKLILERFGYRVLPAGQGAEALAIYAAHPDQVAVVLTDMAMPVMDGPAMITALKALNPRLKIIGSSGLTTQDAAGATGGVFVDRFLPKPYTAEAMLSALAAVLKPE